MCPRTSRVCLLFLLLPWESAAQTNYMPVNCSASHISQYRCMKITWIGNRVEPHFSDAFQKLAWVASHCDNLLPLAAHSKENGAHLEGGITRIQGELCRSTFIDIERCLWYSKDKNILQLQEEYDCIFVTTCDINYCVFVCFIYVKTGKVWMIIYQYVNSDNFWNIELGNYKTKFLFAYPYCLITL